MVKVNSSPKIEASTVAPAAEIIVGAEGFDFVEVRRVGGALKRRWRPGTELFRCGHGPGSDVSPLGEGGWREGGWRRYPDTRPAARRVRNSLGRTVVGAQCENHACG